ncbi:MAG: sigma-70 family RNA polymerase sigma factor [Planctomycetes bacterium]|nr:sigma-70 family RNA polymerase sigma factor [Planctomycetota bacterium]MCH8192709.1 sigma-70 family RNA polymerase sigma factor [Planctomycetota bacterium]
MTILTGEIINRYERVTLACCRSYRLSRDTIDDLTHDTFLAAYRNMSACRDPSKLSAWLWTIAHRQMIDQLRRTSARKRKEAIDPHFRPLASPVDPETIAQSRELRQALHAHIAALPPAWMTVVKLFYWHNKNTQEIAMHMQMEPGTVRVILHRSRQRLRRELEALHAA